MRKTKKDVILSVGNDWRVGRFDGRSTGTASVLHASRVMEKVRQTRYCRFDTGMYP